MSAWPLNVAIVKQNLTIKKKKEKDEIISFKENYYLPNMLLIRLLKNSLWLIGLAMLSLNWYSMSPLKTIAVKKL